MKMLFSILLLLPFLSFTATNETDVFFGDSITFGNELYPNQYTERWTTKYCNSVSTDEINGGTSGAAMTPGLNPGRPVFSSQHVPVYQSPFRHLFLSYWVNDFIYGGTPAAYAAATSAAVDDIIAKGWPADKIVLCFNFLPESGTSWPYLTNAVAIQWLAALRSVQQTKGTSFLDFYTPIYNRPDKASYSTDDIHPTAPWNTIMKQYVLTNIEQPSSTLPANFISFSGQRQTNNNLLNWTVAQEQNVSHYEVERSTNGGYWVKAGTVNSLGSSSVQRSYSFTDNTTSNSKQLYRIRAEDKNGALKYSSIIIISAAKPKAITLSGLFPNPAGSKLSLSVEAPAKENASVTVLDVTGHVVKMQKATLESGSNTLELGISHISAGTYIIKLTSESNHVSTTRTFVKE